MKSNEEFISGIYEKAAARQSSLQPVETKTRSFSWNRWSGLAAAACFCVIIAAAVFAGGSLRKTADNPGNDGNAHMALESDENRLMQGRCAEPENTNAGIATMSLRETEYLHGTVKELAEVSEPTNGCVTAVKLQLSDTTEIAVIYVADQTNWKLEEEVWLAVESDEEGYYLVNLTDKYVLKEDGMFYNTAGVAFDNSVIE
ncbi:MAG: hypothetical protein IJY09_00325 [Lachnospiraceae bacterium]|nr:hypothetical protein [Lachnospiraceae bacterium]